MSENSFAVFRDEHFMDLTLYQYGREKCSPLHSFGPFVRNHYLFHYIISGKGVLYANDAQQTPSVYHIRAGCGFLIEPGLVISTMRIRRTPGSISGWSSAGCAPENISRPPASPT